MTARRIPNSAPRKGSVRILSREETLRRIDEEFAALQAAIAARAKEAGLTEEDVAREIAAFRRGK